MNNFSELARLFKICNENLIHSKECMSYLNGRGICADDVKEFKIGYFPQNVNTLSKFVNKEIMLKLNIFDFNGSSFSDYYSLVFPIHDEYSRPVGISGRVVMSEDERSSLGISKYKNSSYKKSNILFGLNKSRQHVLRSKNVFVVEGYFDYISMIKNKIKNCVAICGTAFSSNHFTKLAKYTDQITFLLDADDAGIISTERIYSKFSNKGIKLRFLKIDDKFKDVDEFFSNEETSDSLWEHTTPVIPGVW